MKPKKLPPLRWKDPVLRERFLGAMRSGPLGENISASVFRAARELGVGRMEIAETAEGKTSVRLVDFDPFVREEA